jgi:fructose-bisphosphate aldolase class II
MIDGSHLDFEENIAMTKHVVKLARSKGVSVEAEHGKLVSQESTAKDAEDPYTDPFTSSVREVLVTSPKEYDPRKILGPAKETMKAVVKEKMRLFGSSGKAP